MFDENELNAADGWIDDWQTRIERRAAAVRDLADQLQVLTASAQSTGNLVRATVNSAGVLTELSLHEDVRAHSADWIADQILTTMRSATDEMDRRIRRVSEETVGADSATGAAFLEALETQRSPGRTATDRAGG